MFFSLGLATSALWSHRATKRETAADQEPQLSDTTKVVLDHLERPVEVRFYSLLDPSAPASLGAFSGRVDQLLSAYQRQANGKILVTRRNAQANTSATTALADGIKGFNLDKGEGCFLGVALLCNGKKETLAQLSPEWEPALESDLSRAIGRLTEAPQAAATMPAPEAAVTEEVKRMFPNIASVSLEEGTRTLRETALKEFTAAVSEMQAQMMEAQGRLQRAQNNGSTAEQESAMKQLQEVQAGQAEKLKQVAARSQAQLAAFQQLKAGSK